jgi:tRNA(fMet)-specific endonuclease VapC
MDNRKMILDTSAYSNFLRGNPGIKSILQHVDEIYINPIIIGELLAGFISGKNEIKNRALLQEFISSPRVQIIDIDDETSERYAVIINYLRAKGSPVPTNDLWIAASAMQYGLKVITSDQHYLKIPHIITEYYDEK